MGKCEICGKSIKYNRYVKYRKKIYCLECWESRQRSIVRTNKTKRKQFTEEVDLSDLED